MNDDQNAGSAPTSPEQAPPLYGVGPFTLRELILLVVWVIAFAVSFFSTTGFVFSSVWTRGIDWILPIGLPTVAVFLLILRRFSPTGIRRVGSLGIDQFASVAFSVSAVVWLADVVSQFSVVVAGGPWALSWVPWVELVLMLCGVVLTVFAPLIPGLDVDFRGRPEASAHPSARPVRAVTPRPRPVAAPSAPAPSAPAPDPYAGQGQGTPAQDPYAAAPEAAATTASAEAPEPAPADTASFAPASDGAASTADEDEDDLDATVVRDDVTTARDAEEEPAAPAAHQAFWALVPEERDVVDEDGVPVFRIGPTAWALAIEDRGSSLVIRHEDGRVGRLMDVSGVTRG